jgi:hypothetical protein
MARASQKVSTEAVPIEEPQAEQGPICTVPDCDKPVFVRGLCEITGPTRGRKDVGDAGWVILRILALVPFLGGFAWLVATVLGLGTLWVTARAAPREVGAVAPALAPPPPVTR